MIPDDLYKDVRFVSLQIWLWTSFLQIVKYFLPI